MRGDGGEGSIVKEIMRSHLIWEGTSTVPQCAPRHDSALDPKPGGIIRPSRRNAHAGNTPRTEPVLDWTWPKMICNKESSS